jgi:hypothetical protein
MFSAGPCWGLVGSTLLGPEGISTHVVWVALWRRLWWVVVPPNGLRPGLGVVWGVVVGAAVSGEGGLSVL